jgi:hypothetical protein
MYLPEPFFSSPLFFAIIYIYADIIIAICCHFHIQIANLGMYNIEQKKGRNKKSISL